MEVPRPTLADVDLPPRRRLRDGSRSVRSSSTLSSVPPRVTRTRTTARSGRGRSVSTLSTLSTLSSNTSSFSGSSLSAASLSRASNRSRSQGIQGDYAMNGNNHVDDNGNDIEARVDHGSTLIDMINATEHHNDNEDVEESLADRQSRYTAAEKGKGRAGDNRQSRGKGKGGGRETIIVDDEEEEIQVTGVKRKIHEIESESDAEELAEEEEGEDTRLGAYNCPICFTEPTNGVMTTCGHILCSKCLFSCLLAAIARHPNPHPQHQPRSKPKKKSRSKSKKTEPQPVEWTADQLSETWRYYRDLEYEQIAKEAGLDAIDIEAGRDTSEVGVEMILKGLWKVDGQLVVEGECPVCRKGLPGGYGPPGKRIGGVIPVVASIGGG